MAYSDRSPAIRVWRLSANGIPHSYYETARNVPRIPDVHLQSVVFIYPSEQDALDGRQLGGSGFVVNYPTGVGTRVPATS